MNGEFAIDLIDIKKKQNTLTLYLARDHCGIRPLFYGESDESFAWSSEVKGLTHNLGKDGVSQIISNISQLPPRKVLKVNMTNT